MLEVKESAPPLDAAPGPAIWVSLFGADRQPLRDITQVRVFRASDKKEIASAEIQEPVYAVRLELGERYEGELLVVRAFPMKHRAVGQFVRVRENEREAINLFCPVRPDKVTGVNFSPFFWGQFGSRSEKTRAGFRNLWAKLCNTEVARGLALSLFVREVVRVQSDRIWIEAAPTLFQEVDAAAVEGERFERASGLLHSYSAPRLGSFKTCDRYGSLQLTFFGQHGSAIVEADLDEAKGIGHLFQVLRNALPGVATDPYDLHQILTFHQKLEPGYELIV